MADNKDKGRFDADATSSTINVNEAVPGLVSMDSPPAEDYNATMMAIDVSKLNLDATKTQIKVDVPSDEEILQEKIEQKKMPLARFWGQLKRIFTPAGDISNFEVRVLPKWLRKFQGIWLCDPNASVHSFALFYVSRLVLIGLSLYLHGLLFASFSAVMAAEHPAAAIFVVVVGSELTLLVLAILFRAAPSWLVALPLSAFALLMAYGAVFYHTADKLYFIVNGQAASEWLNGFFLIALIFSGLTSVFLVAQKGPARIVNFVLGVVALVPIVANVTSGTLFELSFFASSLGGASGSFLNPSVLLVHGLFPVFSLYFFIRSLMAGRTGTEKVAGGFARSLAFLFLAFTVLGGTLMQKNRIFHLGNLVVPTVLNVGAAEIEVHNRKLKVETKTFAKSEGADTKTRYQFLLKTGKKPGQFQLLAVDEYNFPIKSLAKSDLTVSVDGQKIKDYKLVEESSNNRGIYSLTLQVDKKDPLVTWVPIAANLKSEDFINFTISEPERVGRFSVVVADEAVFDIADPKTEVKVPLNRLSEGEHELQLSVLDIYEQEIFKQELKIRIVNDPSFKILKPLDGDSVGDNLEVVLMSSGKATGSVVLSLDGIVAGSMENPAGFLSLATADLPLGLHSLTAVAQMGGKEIKQTVSFKRVVTAPVLMITSPSMGVFATRETKVAFELKGGSASMAKTAVSVNGFVLPDVVVKNHQFTLPVSQWQGEELFVTIQSTLDNGEKVSDWVQINKSLSQLKLSFDGPSLSFLSLDSVAFVLDASVSSWDNWVGTSKWFAVKDLLSDGDVEAKLGHTKAAVIVYGSEKPHYFKDCDDAKVIVKSGVFDAGDVKKALGVKPKGVSALVAGLKHAFVLKPAKVFVFTDAADACKPDLLAALANVMAESPGTRVYVYALGRIAPDAKNQLSALAEKTGGRYYQPERRDTLKEALLEQLQLSYSLDSDGHVLHQGPFETHEFSLVPGPYVLRIPYGVDIKSMEFKLDNGVQKTLSIIGEHGQIVVEDKTEKSVN